MFPFSYGFQCHSFYLVPFFVTSLSLLKFTIFMRHVLILKFFGSDFLSFLEHIYDRLLKVFVW